MKKTPLKKISKKQSKKLAQYTKIRKEFFSLPENKSCRVHWHLFHSVVDATDIHHKSGRIGNLLFDTRYWLPVCRSCHRYITDNPEWAYSKEYSYKH